MLHWPMPMLLRAEKTGYVRYSRARRAICKALNVAGYEIWPEIYSRIRPL
jgi:lambda repressor-like predicted transcriptional regulator